MKLEVCSAEVVISNFFTTPAQIEAAEGAWCITTDAPITAREALDLAGVSVDELDAFIPHQANLRITQTLAKNIQIPDSVAIATDVIDSGNTSAASVPLAMEAIAAERASIPTQPIARQRRDG